MSATANTPQESAWFDYTDCEYYNRVRAIMLESGIGEGDVENILANVWKSGFLSGEFAAKSKAQE